MVAASAAGGGSKRAGVALTFDHPYNAGYRSMFGRPGVSEVVRQVAALGDIRA